jgi:hypothetical protein
MRTLRTTREIAISFVLLGTVIGGTLLFSQNAPSPELLIRHEAEILIYMLPPARQVRAQGMEVGWELERSAKWNQRDYFFFWVYNTRRPEAGSVTIGHFAVNKHTADVREMLLDTIVEDHELQGVQNILRRAHGIDERTIKKHRNLGLAEPREKP